MAASSSSTKTPSRRSTKRAWLREPPQRNVTGSLWSATIRAHRVDVPDVVLVVGPRQRLPGDRVALVGEHPVAVHDVVAAALELGRHGRLAGARDALDEVVADAHRTSIKYCQRNGALLADRAVGGL